MSFSFSESEDSFKFDEDSHPESKSHSSHETDFISSDHGKSTNNKKKDSAFAALDSVLSSPKDDLDDLIKSESDFDLSISTPNIHSSKSNILQDSGDILIGMDSSVDKKESDSPSQISSKSKNTKDSRSQKKSKLQKKSENNSEEDSFDIDGEFSISETRETSEKILVVEKSKSPPLQKPLSSALKIVSESDESGHIDIMDKSLERSDPLMQDTTRESTGNSFEFSVDVLASKKKEDSDFDVDAGFDESVRDSSPSPDNSTKVKEISTKVKEISTKVKEETAAKIDLNEDSEEFSGSFSQSDAGDEKLPKPIIRTSDQNPPPSSSTPKEAEEAEEESQSFEMSEDSFAKEETIKKKKKEEEEKEKKKLEEEKEEKRRKDREEEEERKNKQKEEEEQEKQEEPKQE
ncbi:hypothetical protein ADUPG1_011782, partial [Aduncisulcus paluster]